MKVFNFVWKIEEIGSDYIEEGRSDDISDLCNLMGDLVEGGKDFDYSVWCDDNLEFLDVLKNDGDEVEWIGEGWKVKVWIDESDKLSKEEWIEWIVRELNNRSEEEVIEIGNDGLGLFE